RGCIWGGTVCMNDQDERAQGAEADRERGDLERAARSRSSEPHVEQDAEYEREERWHEGRSRKEVADEKEGLEHDRHAQPDAHGAHADRDFGFVVDETLGVVSVAKDLGAGQLGAQLFEQRTWGLALTGTRSARVERHHQPRGQWL